VLIGVTRLASETRAVVGAVGGLGFLLLAGTLMSELGETFGVPHLTSYIATGFIAGPSVLGLVDHDTVSRLSPIDTLSVALIALAGGCELRIDMLRSTMRSLAWSTLFQTTIVFVVSGAAFLALGRYIPFVASMKVVPALGTALLWASVSVTRSPSALLGILAQTRARGPLTTFSLSFIMLSDVVVILVAAIAIVFARPLLEPSSGLSFADIELFAHEVVGSFALGVTLGIILATYLRLVGGNLLVVLIVLGLGFSELLRYIQFDALLAFIVAGFVVENFSSQGSKLHASVSGMSTVVFVIFFALAGAHLDLDILRKLGAIALALATIRAVATLAASRLSSRMAEDSVIVRRWGWSSMISQSGVTLGLALVVVHTFPSIGEAFLSLVIAVLSVNQVVGPVLFKIALDRSGESSRVVTVPTGGSPKPAEGLGA
jgi:Kef-type K+ transport system membrane component KefB